MGLEGVSGYGMNRYADILYAACSFLGLAGICLIAAGMYLRRRVAMKGGDKLSQEQEETKQPSMAPIPPPAEEEEPPIPISEPTGSPTSSFIPAQLIDSVDVSETAIAPKARKTLEEDEEGMAELPPFPAPPPLPAPPPTTSGFFPLGQAIEEEDNVGEDDATVLVQRNPPKRV